MIGAERHASDRYSAWEQYTPATVHWQLPDGGVGWMAVRTNAAPAFEAGPRTFTLAAAEGTQKAVTLELRIRAPSGEPPSFGATRWRLPGLEVEVENGWGEPQIERDGPETRLRWLAASARDRVSLSFP